MKQRVILLLSAGLLIATELDARVAMAGHGALSGDPALVSRVQRVSDRINNRLRHEGHQLSRRDLMDVLDNLRVIARILNEDGEDGTRPNPPPSRPNPPPRPDPNPPRPPSSNAVVRGVVERSSFTFEGYSLDELYGQCESFYQNEIRGSSVDDIEVSTNFGPTDKLRNSSSFWKTSAEVCGQIIGSVRRNSSLPVSRHDRYVLIGKIENTPYRLRGRDLIELNRECEAHYAATRPGSVDDITVSVNFGPEIVLRNSSSYWRTAFEVCQQIIARVN